MVVAQVVGAAHAKASTVQGRMYVDGNCVHHLIQNLAPKTQTVMSAIVMTHKPKSEVTIEFNNAMSLRASVQYTGKPAWSDFYESMDPVCSNCGDMYQQDVSRWQYECPTCGDTLGFEDVELPEEPASGIDPEIGDWITLKERLR